MNVQINCHLILFKNKYIIVNTRDFSNELLHKIAENTETATKRIFLKTIVISLVNKNQKSKIKI